MTESGENNGARYNVRKNDKKLSKIKKSPERRRTISFSLSIPDGGEKPCNYFLKIKEIKHI